MRRISKSTLIAVGATLACVAVPAFAQGQNIGDSANNLFNQFSGIANVLTGGSFLAGIGLGGAAALKFKAHSENPQQVPLKHPLGYAAAASLCIGLPAFLNMGAGTFFGGSQNNSLNAGTYQTIGQ